MRHPHDLIALTIVALAAACGPITATVDSCSEDSDCKEGQRCVADRCRTTCRTSADCGEDMSCVSKICLPDDNPQPDASVPDVTDHDAERRDSATPDTRVTDRASTDAAGPDLAATDRQSPDTAGPDLWRPDTCAPGTCLSLGYACGDHDNGCGGPLSCGDCRAGQTCQSNGQCSSCSYTECNDSCCAQGQICHAVNDTCCSPATCGSLHVACGTHDNGCGAAMGCGTCGLDAYCVDNQSCQALGFTMRTISAGSFFMGSPGAEPGRDDHVGWYVELDETLHSVSLTHDFEIANKELSQADFQTLMGYQPAHFSSCGGTCPVENLTWSEAAALCNKLSLLKGLTPCFTCTGVGNAVTCQVSSGFDAIYQCPGFRFPTEAEWEYAARGGSQSAFSNGAITQPGCDPVDPNLNAVGWYLGNGAVGYAGAVDVTCESVERSIGPHPVAGRNQNAYGVYDMHGNVWEWVMECEYTYGSDSRTDPVGPLVCEKDRRLYRGGGAGNVAAFCRAAERAAYSPDGKNIDIGFRVARTLE